MKTPSGYIQGYNAQAIANENQIVLAATVTSEQNDYDQLHPMMDAMHQNLQAAGVEQKVGTLVADSGYLSDANLLAAADDTPELLIAVVNDRDQRVDKKAPRGRIPKDLSPTKRLARKLATKRGQTSTENAARWWSRCSRTARPEDADASCAEDGPRATASGSSSTLPTTSSSCGALAERRGQPTNSIAANRSPIAPYGRP